MTTLRITNPGLLTTVQDLGRSGLGRFGVPVSGAMDPVRGPRSQPTCRERRLGRASRGDRLGRGRVLAPGPVRDRRRGPLGDALRRASRELTAKVASPGDRLAFLTRRRGARAYLAVAGGILVPEVLGSRSTDLESRIGGLEGRPLRSGDTLATGPYRRFAPRSASLEVRTVYREPFVLRFLPAASPLLEEALALFITSTFRVSSKISRMGYRLEGPELSGPPLGEMLSEPIPPGTVQLPAEGSPILLMADRQTVGGYPRLGSVIAADTPRAAQLFTGHPVRFVPVSLASAHAALREQETILGRMSA